MSLKKILKTVAAVAAMFGFAVGACADDRLNGTWVTDGGEFFFDNGNFEVQIDGIQAIRGTYSAANGRLSFNPTHTFGDFHRREMEHIVRFDSRWYTIDEFVLILKSELVKNGASEKDANIFVASVSNIFSEIIPPATYSFNNNSLTLTTAGGRATLVLNRR